MTIQFQQRILARSNQFSAALGQVDEVVIEPSAISISPTTARDLHIVRIWGTMDGVRDGDSLLELKPEIISEEFTTASINIPISMKVRSRDKLF